MGDRRLLFWFGVTAAVHVAALVFLHLAAPRSARTRLAPRVARLSVETPTVRQEELPAWLREPWRNPFPGLIICGGPYWPPDTRPSPRISTLLAAQMGDPWRFGLGDTVPVGLDNIGVMTGLAYGYAYEYGRPAPPEGAPRVRVGAIEVVRGRLSIRAIRRVVHRHLDDIRSCYEQQLGPRPDLQGSVSVAFLVGSTGAVQWADVSASDLGPPLAYTCITAAVQGWSFPAGRAGRRVFVKVPFILDRIARGRD